MVVILLLFITLMSFAYTGAVQKLKNFTTKAQRILHEGYNYMKIKLLTSYLRGKRLFSNSIAIVRGLKTRIII